MAELTMIKAITNALDMALAKDDKVLIFGEDVGKNGGVFRATIDLQAKYGEDRVFDTPLAESGIIGLSLGLALEGFRPIPELQFFPFVYEAIDPIVGQIARTRFRNGSTKNAPITIRAPFGGGVHTAELHSDSVESLITNSPGIRVVTPSNPYDAKGLLLASIESNDPVLFLEHMKLYRSFRDEVPEDYYTVPLDKAKVVKEGSDITLVTYAYMVRESLKACEELEEEGISVELIDLRTIQPIDYETILESLKKTHKLIVVQEAQRQAGVSSQVMAEVAERGILYLDAPIARVASPDTIYPFGLAENIWIPDKEEIKKKVRETVNFN